LGITLAIAAGIISAAVGAVATYFVMTSVLDYKLEPGESAYKSSGDGNPGRGGMAPGGKGGMKGGKGGKGPAGQGDKGGGPPGGAMNDVNEQDRIDRLLAWGGAAHPGSFLT
jgi:hypothetical protein